MIQNKQQLKEYIEADESRYYIRSPRFLGWLLSDESYFVLKYLKTLRWLEYYTNKTKYVWDYPILVYLLLKHRRLSLKYGIKIEPNVVGKGLYIPHFLGGVIVNAFKLGDYCTITAGCVIGSKTGQDLLAEIGNNVEIAIGAKIIGAIKIGDNSIIAPNSVVVKDVAPNSIVSGIPAKFLKETDASNKLKNFEQKRRITIKDRITKLIRN